MSTLELQASARIAALSESETLAMAQRVRQLRAQGRDIISLTLGEPDFDTPAHIREAAKAAIDQGFTRYPPIAGYPELQDAIVRKLARENGLHYQRQDILVSTGAKQSLINYMLALLNPGDEVLLLAPYWVSYRAMVELAGAVPVVVPTSAARGWQPEAARVQAALSPRTRLIVLNSPSNPSGAMLERHTLDELAQVLAPRPDIWLMSDEIYEHISFGTQHHSPAAWPSLYPRTITVNGLSKSFAMTGWRLGYAAAPAPLTRLAEKVQGQFTSGACSITQRAAIAALDGPMDAVQHMVDAFARRRTAGSHALKSLLPQAAFQEPQGAFYFWLNVSPWLGLKQPSGGSVHDSADLANFALDTTGVATVPGTAFGQPEYLRLSFACHEDSFRAGVQALAHALAQLH